jgi:hypothetical protein
MAEQGSYPLNGRSLQGTDTCTGVVTGQTADIPLSALAAFVGQNSTQSGPTSGRPTPSFIGQFYFDTTLGLPIYCGQIFPVVWVNAAGVSV